MAEVLLFHHAQGLTRGCISFADRLRTAEHLAHAPDLYDGKIFTDLTDGGSLRPGSRLRQDPRSWSAVSVLRNSLPNGVVYAGFSLGVMPAQKLAQTRAGARGALLFYSCAPTSEFGGPWPRAGPLQIHMMDADEWVLPITVQDAVGA